MRLSAGVRPTEAQWVAGLQRGDATAQRQVYDQYAGRMLATCLRYVGDQPEAEDLMIGGFLKVFDKVGQFRGEGSFEGWVRRIMVNEALMQLRQRELLTVSFEEFGQPENLAVTAATADTALQAEDLLGLLATLPAGYRTVFNLYALEGYGHQEIAELLGISEGTSKSQLSKARALLQRRVQFSAISTN